MQPDTVTEALSNHDFVYYPDEWDAEEPTRYEPGGYHPVVLGNIFRSPAGTPSYRIIHKLGHGSFSTVWLAENSDSNPKYVAVKVSTADGMSSSEADYLRAISSPYIVPVTDSFSLEGPNGLHHILVTDVLIPVLDFTTVPHTLDTRKKLIWELVKAVEDLHEAGLVHGDLHVGNIGITLPQLQSLDVSNLLFKTNRPVMTAILLEDATKSTASLPAYITGRCDMTRLYKKVEKEVNYEPRAKLFDFGSARRQGEDSKNLMCIMLSRAPEIARALEVDKGSNPLLQPAADVWSLGTVIFEIMTGFHIFSRGYLYPPATHLAQLESPNGESSLDRSAAENEWWRETWDDLRKNCVDDTDCNTLVTLLKTIFVLEPSERPSASTIAQDDWFHKIRTAHRNTLPHSYSTVEDL